MDTDVPRTDGAPPTDSLDADSLFVALARAARTGDLHFGARLADAPPPQRAPRPPVESFVERTLDRSIVLADASPGREAAGDAAVGPRLHRGRPADLSVPERRFAT